MWHPYYCDIGKIKYSKCKNWSWIHYPFEWQSGLASHICSDFYNQCYSCSEGFLNKPEELFEELPSAVPNCLCYLWYRLVILEMETVEREQPAWSAVLSVCWRSVACVGARLSIALSGKDFWVDSSFSASLTCSWLQEWSCKSTIECSSVLNTIPQFHRIGDGCQCTECRCDVFKFLPLLPRFFPFHQRMTPCHFRRNNEAWITLYTFPRTKLLPSHELLII